MRDIGNLAHECIAELIEAHLFGRIERQGCRRNHLFRIDLLVIDEKLEMQVWPRGPARLADCADRLAALDSVARAQLGCESAEVSVQRLSLGIVLDDDDIAIAALVADELDRANVLATGRQPQNVVRMRSDVEFRDDVSGKVQTVTLVYPDEADIAQGKISVLTPIGTALIGLTIGEPITWRTRSGELRCLTVLKVRMC